MTTDTDTAVLTDRLYSEQEMVILRAAANLLGEAQQRWITAFFPEDGSYPHASRWARLSGTAGAASEVLQTVVFRHDRYTTPEDAA